MALEPGRQLAHYEIVEPIGKGGMGEVYRATDRKLGRDVAIKVLPEEFARDAERLARFQREAKVLASLNHPNIAAIYGLEQSDDTHYLVLELVPGETLAERIARGPVPVDEAVAIAGKIAGALEEAHERGIVHRDLKPANVKLTPDDDVKVLDFGLAKAFVDESGAADSSMSPTITRDATRAGVILGTAAYMSPEQAKGKRVDRRADIWAFGAVLYEMLTGERAFHGEDVSDTLAAVLRAEPAWDELPPQTPAALGNVLELCLTKDANLRVRDIGDVRLAMHGAFATKPETSEAPLAPSRTFSWAPVVLASLVAGVAVWLLTQPPPPTPAPTRRFSLELPPENELTAGLVGGTFFALPRDGSELVYIGDGENGRQLYRRSMRDLDVVPIRDTLEPWRPFYSPDKKWIGFFTNDGLKKVSLAGGPAVTICDDPSCTRLETRGGSWTLDGRIVLGRVADGLAIVSADGGTPETLTTADGRKDHLYPTVLPNGSAVLFTDGVPSYSQARVVLYELGNGEYRALFDGTTPRYALGHILFAREDSLWAVPFDLDALEIEGEPFLVQEGIARPNGVLQYRVAGDGTLVYMRGGGAGTVPSTVTWMDREGRASPLPGITEGFYRTLRFSPDGTRLALEVAPSDLWVYDIERESTTRLTTGSETEFNPLWSHDGERLLFGSTRNASSGLYRMNADGTGAIEQLMTDDANFVQPHDWTPDGTSVLFSGLYSSGSWGIGLFSMSEDRDFEFLIQTEFSENHPAVSPDGRWLAYTSDLSGVREVYVERFPILGDRRLISVGGGRLPVWSRDGRELFYMSANRDKIMAAPFDSETGFRTAAPEVLFEGRFYQAGGLRSYDVAPDGQRFVILTFGDEEEEQANKPGLVVVQNWLSEHER